MEQRLDNTISLIRCISMCFIVLCHLLNYWGSVLAWWFDVGVQIFLILSGYLYGGKRIDGYAFLKHTLRRILTSYYIVVIPMGLIALVWIKSITPTQFIYTILTQSLVPGGEHLWFIPYILCCYLFTPLLSICFDSVVQPKDIIKRTGVLLAATLIIFRYFSGIFQPGYISCYLVGFALKRLENAQERTLDLKFTSAVII